MLRFGYRNTQYCPPCSSMEQRSILSPHTLSSKTSRRTSSCWPRRCLRSRHRATSRASTCLDLLYVGLFEAVSLTFSHDTHGVSWASRDAQRQKGGPAPSDDGRLEEGQCGLPLPSPLHLLSYYRCAGVDRRTRGTSPSPSPSSPPPQESTISPCTKHMHMVDAFSRWRTDYSPRQCSSSTGSTSTRSPPRKTTHKASTVTYFLVVCAVCARLTCVGVSVCVSVWCVRLRRLFDGH